MDILGIKKSKLLKEYELTKVIDGEHVKDDKVTVSSINWTNPYGGGNPPGLTVPWLKVGKMMVSLTPTHEYTWVYPFVSLYNSGIKYFEVFSGLHGDYPNTYDKSKDTFDARRVENQAHKNDEIIIQHLKKEISGIHIVQHDARKHLKGLNTWIKKESEAALKKGHGVIIAWCFGIYTFHLTHLDQPPVNKMPDESHGIGKEMLDAANMTVHDLVHKQWEWAIKSTK